MRQPWKIPYGLAEPITLPNRTRTRVKPESLRQLLRRRKRTRIRICS